MEKDEIRYCIVTVDDSREEKKRNIREVFSGLTETFPQFYDCRIPEGVEAGLRDHPTIGRADRWTPKAGELGIWYSTLSAWKYSFEHNVNLLVIEDDAMFVADAEDEFMKLINEVPEDWDAYALFVPANQYGDYQWFWECAEDGYEIPGSRYYDKWGAWADIGSETVCRAYQGYSGVANAFSPKGSKALYDIATRTGIYTPVDCFIWERARTKEVQAFSQKPHSRRLVDVDWSAPSTIAQTPIVDGWYT